MNNNSLVAWYPFDSKDNLGKDMSDNGNDAKILGTDMPEYSVIDGKAAVVLKGGDNGSSYIQLPFSVLKNINENTGLSISAWIYGNQCKNGWERVFDFGANERGPYLFMNRFLRAVAFSGEDIAADAGKSMPENEWTHFTYTISPSKNGTESLAGPRLYVNGELVADGIISQTSSGRYKAFRNWESFFYAMDESAGLYIGRSQFAVDPDFNGAVSDFKIYNRALTESEVLAEICNSLSDEEVLKMARDRFLPDIPHIMPLDIKLPSSLMDGKVNIKWTSNEDIFTDEGELVSVSKVMALELTAVLSYNGACLEKEFKCTVLPEGEVCSEFQIKNEKICDISDTLYGLFFEDINHSADGGIYAEMIQNRSFEEFTFDTYDSRSGENGISTGRIHNPLKYWFGDLDNVVPMHEGGMNEQFGLDSDNNATYIKVGKDTCLINRGVCDDMMKPSMKLVQGESYEFSLWMKSEKDVEVQVCLLTANENVVSETIKQTIPASSQWKKCEPVILTANSDALGQIIITFSEEACVDMISLMPVNTWGSNAKTDPESAVANYKGNSNYRMRRDLVDTLRELKPSFLRFPGGCISEGSYIWDNVYDWKDSVGPVELRKENFNVWGYTMTMGLGYMEYFQLAEDLNATPLPVMACGVLCQARSDYANPAGGSLREKYIKNFTDLIDFAISTDFENNEWARVRRDNGHEAPFDLHYLGVGNENWGTEFMANFEIFYDRITSYMKENYPDYNLQIISTVGAQADDDSYQNGWNFLAGGQKGTETIAFTDGKSSFNEEISWYKNKSDYLNTIADEHYYRSNEYMLENADRYNYYYRPCNKMTVVQGDISKVFVGEYASVDKNTMAGAVAEAAVMTGFEKNSDIVRMAAYAPLFNKITDDGNYRWTPDLIWFDNESVWRTPNYYVQQMFASNIGKEAIKTSYKTYVNGEKKEITPNGDVAVFTKGEIEINRIAVKSLDGKVLFETRDIKAESSTKVKKLANGYYIFMEEKENGNYVVEVEAKCVEKGSCYSIATGICGSAFEGDMLSLENISMHEFVVGDEVNGSGLKVYKNGIEGYTLGDYSSSVQAGNLRKFFDCSLSAGESYIANVCFGEGAISGEAKNVANGGIIAQFDNKLDIYNRDIYCSATKDDSKVYIKLVNPNNTDKKTKVEFKDIVVAEGIMVTLVADDENTLHAPNVNRRDDEKVVPKTTKVEVLTGEHNEKYVEQIIKANSVNVITLSL